MADDTVKTASKDQPEGSVLAGLPATRPNRMGRRARQGTSADTTTTAAAESPSARKTPAKPKAKAAAKAKAKPAAKAKAAAKPKPAAKPKAKAAAKTSAAKKAAAKKPAATTPVVVEAPPTPTPIAEGRKPRPVRAGHPGLADRSAKDRPADQRDDKDAGVAATAAQAAGELTKLGVSVLKGIGKRLPRP